MNDMKLVLDYLNWKGYSLKMLFINIIDNVLLIVNISFSKLGICI